MKYHNLFYIINDWRNHFWKEYPNIKSDLYITFAKHLKIFLSSNVLVANLDIHIFRGRYVYVMFYCVIWNPYVTSSISCMHFGYNDIFLVNLIVSYGKILNVLIIKSCWLQVRKGHSKIFQQDIIDVLDKQLLEGMGVLLTEEQQKCEQRVCLSSLVFLLWVWQSILYWICFCTIVILWKEETACCSWSWSCSASSLISSVWLACIFTAPAWW